MKKLSSSHQHEIRKTSIVFLILFENVAGDGDFEDVLSPIDNDNCQVALQKFKRAT